MKILLVTAGAGEARPTPARRAGPAATASAPAATASAPASWLEPESPQQVLVDLGCSPLAVGFDLEGVEEALRDGRAPQAIVLDARERLESGYGCLERLRQLPALSSTPALVVVTVDRLASLDARSADDFVLYPVVPAELYARLRQLDWRLASFRSREQLKVGDLHIDVAGHEARVRDRRLVLTRKEFELLRFLATQPGRVFSREQLLAKVWGYRYAGSGRTVDIHVRRLRAKLGSPADRAIETVRNVGYKMKA